MWSIFMKFTTEIIYKKSLSKVSFVKIGAFNLQICWSFWVKCCIEHLHMIPMSNVEFCENWCSDRHILVYLCHVYFPSVWVTFSIEDFHSLLRDVTEFPSILATFIFDFSESWNNRSANNVGEQLWVLLIQAQGRQYLSYGHKRN
jgi:hypothetical protein